MRYITPSPPRLRVNDNARCNREHEIAQRTLTPPATLVNKTGKSADTAPQACKARGNDTAAYGNKANREKSCPAGAGAAGWPRRQPGSSQMEPPGGGGAEARGHRRREGARRRQCMAEPAHNLICRNGCTHDPRCRRCAHGQRVRRQKVNMKPRGNAAKECVQRKGAKRRATRGVANGATRHGSNKRRSADGAPPGCSTTQGHWKWQKSARRRATKVLWRTGTEAKQPPPPHRPRR